MHRRNKVNITGSECRIRSLEPPRLPVICSSTNEIVSSKDRIYQLARFGDVVGISTLLSQPRHRLQMNKPDTLGATAIHYASRYQQLSVVKLLIKYKADVNVSDKIGASPLHYVCKKKQTSQVKPIKDIIDALIDAGADVTCVDRFGSTPLHYATTHGNFEAAITLLKNNHIDINAKDNLKATPLHESIACHRVEISRRLILAGANILETDDEDLNAIHLAAMSGSLETIALLFSHNKDNLPLDLVNKEDMKGNTALHFAIEGRYKDVVKELIKQGADTNVTCRDNTNSFAPLHLSAISGDIDISNLLIDNDARLDCIDIRGCSPLHWAVEYSHVELVRSLLQRSGNQKDAHNFMSNTPFLIACARGDTTMCDLLLKDDVNITPTDNRERSCLYLSCEEGHLNTVNLILDHMTSDGLEYLIHEPEQAGNTPLHCACFKGHLDIVKVLLKHGANINSKNENGRSCFHLAAMSSHVKVCNFLLLQSDGKCLNDRDEDSNTALHLAVSMHIENIEDVVRLLVESGSDKEARNCYSGTPLDFAIMAGNLDIVEYFMSIKLPINIEENDKLSPLQLACKHGHVSIVNSLITTGADVTYTDVFNRNALDIAIDSNNRHCASSILKSNLWRKALQNESSGHGKAKVTPLRKIIDKMPEIALLVLDRCVAVSTDIQNIKDDDFYIEFDYEFIDDNYVKWMDDGTGKLTRSASIFDLDGFAFKQFPTTYTDDKALLKSNHLLQIMVDKKRDDVILHPVTMSLVRRKWRIANYLYMFFMFFYAIFVICFSVYLVQERPPFYENMYLCEMRTIPSSGNVQHVLSLVVMILAAFGMLNEIFQFLATGYKYLGRVLNLVDWLGYIGAILTCLDFTNCQLRTAWQWQLGALTLFLLWMELILLMRIFPIFGVFAVMIIEILKTFSRFAIMYLMFLIAFGLSFYLLINNQNGFHEPVTSIIKAAVYHLGENDYAATFHSTPDTLDNNTMVADNVIVYKTTTYVIFVAYLILMSIVVINLLTALAVDDVNKLREIARLERIDMQIELALDVEIAMPNFILKRICPLVSKEKWYPNRKSITSKWLTPFVNFWNWLTQGRLNERILEAVVEIQKRKNNKHQKPPGSKEENIQDIALQLDRIEDLLVKTKRDISHSRRKKRDRI